METVTLRYSEQLIRKAVRTFWWRQVGWTYVIVLALTTVAVVWLVAAGDRSWYVGVLASVVAASFILIAALYVVHMRRALARLARMKTPEATLELDDEFLHITSDSGEMRARWSLVTRIWRFEGFWLLFFSAGEFMILPTASLSDVEKAFIASRIEGGNTDAA